MASLACERVDHLPQLSALHTLERLSYVTGSHTLERLSYVTGSHGSPNQWGWAMLLCTVKGTLPFKMVETSSEWTDPLH